MFLKILNGRRNGFLKNHLPSAALGNLTLPSAASGALCKPLVTFAECLRLALGKALVTFAECPLALGKKL